MPIRYVEVYHVGNGNYHFRLEYSDSEVKIYYDLTLEQLTDIIEGMILTGEINPAQISEFNL